MDVGWQWFTSFQTKSLPALWEAIIHLNYCTLKLDHRKSHVAHSFHECSSSLPACLLIQKYSPVFLPLTWSHAFCCCCLDYTTAGRECSKSYCSFSHQLLHVSISTLIHSIHFVRWSEAWLFFSHFLLLINWRQLCWILTILNTIGQCPSMDIEHYILKTECSYCRLQKNLTLKFPPCAAPASWLRDRWCTRWCLRPAESGSSWSSAVRLKLFGFRFKEKAEADGHRCAICV